MQQRACGALRLAVALCGLLALVGAQDYKKDQWITGRATFYGGSDELVNAYKDRGILSFGIIEYGSCGFTKSDGSLVYPRDTYAALADTNWDYDGSCGRCYEVRCKSGLVMDRGAPLNISKLYYMAGVDASVKDTYGRSFPGNAREKDWLQAVKCWNDSSSIFVRVGDSCPCQQKKGNKTEPQFMCCGGANHMDLSFWAFEKLAHPVYGVIPTEYRPVNCETKQPINPVPGFVDNTIYRDDLGAGWSWRPYSSKNSDVRVAGEGVGGGHATCLTSSPGGAVVFVAKRTAKPPYQLFRLNKTSRLDFWIKSNTKTNDPYASSTPPGKVPGMKVFLMNDEKNLYCGREIYLNQTKVAEQKGDWYKFKLPLELFQCNKGSAAALANINRIDISNPNIRDANYCLDNIVLVPRPPPSAKAAPAPKPADSPKRMAAPKDAAEAPKADAAPKPADAPKAAEAKPAAAEAKPAAGEAAAEPKAAAEAKPAAAGEAPKAEGGEAAKAQEAAAPAPEKKD